MKKFVAKTVILMSFSIALICSCEQKSISSNDTTSQSASIGQDNVTDLEAPIHATE
jgi:hypothetical protein